MQGLPLRSALRRRERDTADMVCCEGANEKTVRMGEWVKGKQRKEQKGQ